MKRTGLRRKRPLGGGAGPKTGGASGRAGARRAERTARKLRALRARASAETLSAWESTLLSDTADGLPERLERFGRAYRNPALGDARDPQAPLSLRQHAKVRQIARDVDRRTRTR